MNREQYEQYEKDVAAFMEKEGINCLTVKQSESESYFSHRSCDCCESGLGGEREDCCGFNPETKEIQDGYSVCFDCIYYAVYGELGDDIMMGLDD